MSYLLKNIPRSTKEAIDTLAQDKVATIVKNSIVTYIDRFLNSTGVNRAIAKELGTNSLQYIADKKLEPNADPNNRQTQLAVLTDDLVEKIPCVLVTDDSLEWVPSGLGHKDDEYQEGPDLVQSFSFVYMCELKIFVVTHDEASTKDLTSLIALMFGPLQNLAGGSLIRSDDPQSAWEINLPIIFPAPAFRKELVPGDTVTNMWIGEITIANVKYENKALIKFAKETVTQGGAIVDAPNAYIEPQMLYTGNIKVGETRIIPIRFLEPDDTFMVNNLAPFVADWQVHDQANLEVTGNKIGKFEVIVMDKKGKVKVKQEYNVVY